LAGELEGQVALVTGGGRGLGADLARDLAAAGARVAVAGRTVASVEAVAAELRGLALVGDVTRQEDSERWVAEIESQLGPIDLLVNNAGVGGSWKPLHEEDPGVWWNVLEVNLLGPFLVSRAVVPGMVDRGSGRVVNIGSGAAYLPMHGPPRLRSSYGPSKAALHRFTEELAGEVRERGVYVFCISPGVIRTEMTAWFPENTSWTPPEVPARLVRRLATGALDALTGRYLSAWQDDLDELEKRQHELVEQDRKVARPR
jgi:3-oxoacyl-[acyl-carrier protein] reductase